MRCREFWEGRPAYGEDAETLRQFIERNPDIQKHLARKPEQEFMKLTAHGHVVYFEIHKSRWLERQWKSPATVEILKDYPELNEQ